MFYVAAYDPCGLNYLYVVRISSFTTNVQFILSKNPPEAILHRSHCLFSCSNPRFGKSPGITMHPSPTTEHSARKDVTVTVTSNPLDYKHNPGFSCRDNPDTDVDV